MYCTVCPHSQVLYSPDEQDASISDKGLFMLDLALRRLERGIFGPNQLEDSAEGPSLYALVQVE